MNNLGKTTLFGLALVACVATLFAFTNPAESSPTEAMTEVNDTEKFLPSTFIGEVLDNSSYCIEIVTCNVLPQETVVMYQKTGPLVQVGQTYEFTWNLSSFCQGKEFTYVSKSCPFGR